MKSHADRVTRARNFTAARAWGATGIAQMNDITARLHRTHDPRKWHVNDGDDVFTVLDGRVDLHVQRMGGIAVGILGVGDVSTVPNLVSREPEIRRTDAPAATQHQRYRRVRPEGLFQDVNPFEQGMPCGLVWAH